MFTVSNKLSKTKYFCFILTLNCKYGWVIFVFKNSSENWFYYIFCNRIKLRCLEIFRSFAVFEKKSLRVSAVSDSVFKISPFPLTLILSLMHDLSESNGFIVLQNILSLVLSFTFIFFAVFLSLIILRISLPIIKNLVIFRPTSQKVITKSWFLHYFFIKLFCHKRHLITSNILLLLRGMLIQHF